LTREIDRHKNLSTPTLGKPTMALNAALKQLIETKLAHTHKPQRELPIADVRRVLN
jgi:hypothetical protein